MFNLVHDTMKHTDSPYYEEKLDFLFREFIDLKCMLDPWHEKDVLANLMYNLAAIALCRKSLYIATIWQHAYGKEPFNIDAQQGYTYKDYASQLETMIRLFDTSKTGELEMIRMLICYTKAKGYDPQNIFLELIKKLEDRV